MKTDTIFYSLFKTFPGIFFELIGYSASEANAYQFSSVEIKQTAFRIDGLFIPRTDTPNHPLYFIEVQFQRDANFYSRLFAEIFLYLHQYKPISGWRVVVIYPSRNIDIGKQEDYRELLTSQRVRRIYLNELDEEAKQSLGVKTVALVVEPEESTGEKAKILIEQAQQEVADEAIKQKLIGLIETIVIYKLPQKSRKEIEKMLGLDDLAQTKVYQEAKQEGLQEGLKEGIKEGIKEGLEMGEYRGRLAAVPHLLALGASVEKVAQALGLNLEEVRKIAQSIQSQ